MKKCVQIILILLLFSGCSSFKQGWKNFTAYYNTFYNTKQFYNDGLQSNLRQVPEINPNNLIRIHPPPTNAGLEDFQIAIERASSILRNHDESRYFLPAIFIIGKSYYYRSEYFSALEKFQELASLADGELLQQAVIWQGLIYLETSNYAEGARILEFESDQIENWDIELLAELNIVLAQLYSAQNEFETAIGYLSRSIPNLENSERKARGLFLAGQLYEIIGLDTGARNAYREISGLRISYDLEYHAKRKEAEVLRRIGNYDLAVSIFLRLSRDSKFNDYRNELKYEIARTNQLRGDVEEALEGYQEVLDDRFQVPGAAVRAKTYYGMAEIYRDYLNDFSTAADYFERAASQNADPGSLPVEFDVTELADSFGRYADIKRQLSENDSLLALSSMNDEELKEFIEEVQRLEQNKLEQEMRELQQQQNRVITTEEPMVIQDVDQATEFGFLNINNRSVMLDASLQFQALWGDRALMDNWRRAEAVTSRRQDQIVLLDENDTEIEIIDDESGTTIDAFIELSDIPFSEEEQLSLKREIEVLNYQLANVFFLTLEMPDSAEVYYQKVIESDLDKEIVTMSYYSLAELSLSQNETEQAKEYYFFLELYNPGSTYTTQLAERLGFEQTFSLQLMDDPGTPGQYQRLIQNDEGLNPAERAEEFLKLANRETSEPIIATLLFDAAGEYMKAAQNQGGISQINRMRDWILVRDQFERNQHEFQLKKDSSAVMLNDTTLNDTEMEFWQSIADSTLSEPDFSDYFPYRGAYWDRTRSVLKRIETEYSTASILPRVRVLIQELSLPDESEMDQVLTDSMVMEPGVESMDPQRPANMDPVGTAVESRREVAETGREAEVTGRETAEIRQEDEVTGQEAVETGRETAEAGQEVEVAGRDGETARLEGIYTIVLYSFSNERLAKSKTAELLDREFDLEIFICPRLINETEYWRVSVGSFTDIISAILSSRLLEPPYNSQNFISSINQTCEQIR